MQLQCKIRVVTVLTFLEEIEQKETKITKAFLVWAEQNLCCLCYLLFRNLFVCFVGKLLVAL
jgi:hypothetical protein